MDLMEKLKMHRILEVLKDVKEHRQALSDGVHYSEVYNWEQKYNKLVMELIDALDENPQIS
jgi:hypothetical protein